MHILYWNSLILRFFGFDLSWTPEATTDLEEDSQPKFLLHKLRAVFRRLMKVIFNLHVAVMVITSGYTVYLIMTIKKVDMKFVTSVFMLFFAFNIIIVVMTAKNLPRITRVLPVIFRALNHEEKQLLRKYDRMGVITRSVCTCLPGLLSLSLFFMDTPDISTFKHNMFSGNTVGMLAIAIAYFDTFVLSMFVAHFFVTVLMIATVYSKNCQNRVQELSNGQGIKKNNSLMSPRKLLEMKAILEEYFSFVGEVNDYLGCIPFGMFALLFIFIVFSISMITLNTNLSISFIVIVFGAPILNYVIAIGQVMNDAMNSVRNITDAVSIANNLVDEPVSINTPFDYLEARNCLSSYLQRKDFPVFSAQSMFQIEPSVILSFLNSVVPFTVMFITTIAQLLEDTNKKNAETST